MRGRHRNSGKRRALLYHLVRLCSWHWHFKHVGLPFKIKNILSRRYNLRWMFYINYIYWRPSAWWWRARCTCCSWILQYSSLLGTRSDHWNMLLEKYIFYYLFRCCSTLLLHMYRLGYSCISLCTIAHHGPCLTSGLIRKLRRTLCNLNTTSYADL